MATKINVKENKFNYGTTIPELSYGLVVGSRLELSAFGRFFGYIGVKLSHVFWVITPKNGISIFCVAVKNHLEGP